MERFISLLVWNSRLCCTEDKNVTGHGSDVAQHTIENNEGKYEVDFFVHELRHLTKNAIERVNRLTKGERLFLALDIQNKFDSRAVVLRTADPVEFVGYSPRYLSPAFEQLATENGPAEVKITVERVNHDAPLNLRLLCKLIAPWPADFHPFSGNDFEPLVELPDEIADLIKNQTRR